VVAARIPSWTDSPSIHEGGAAIPSIATLDKPSMDALFTVDMSIQGMTCAACVRRVERKLGKVEGVNATVNLATESARVTLDRDIANEDLVHIVEAAGYSASILSRHSNSSAETPLNEEAATPTIQRHLAGPLEGIEILGALVIRDHLKEGATEAIRQIRDLDITPILLTGDNAGAAHHIAGQLGIEKVIAEVLPEDKRSVIADLQKSGATVAMVGDGVNDAAALAQAGSAGLGMAMGSGSDIAIEVADITLMNSTPQAAPTAIRLSRRTLRIIKENLFWAFAYNIVMIPLAMSGYLSPMIAAAAMALSSVTVVANSLRLRRAR
ncbi:MAG: heavy metal translocating P-type ATPase, partial [Actinomycetaceae bacterium]|nr:heavy metal translocating P-type ATPase [Actinomycetaceae bacterium]